MKKVAINFNHLENKKIERKYKKLKLKNKSGKNILCEDGIISLGVISILFCFSGKKKGTVLLLAV